MWDLKLWQELLKSLGSQENKEGGTIACVR